MREGDASEEREKDRDREREWVLPVKREGECDASAVVCGHRAAVASAPCIMHSDHPGRQQLGAGLPTGEQP